MDNTLQRLETRPKPLDYTIQNNLPLEGGTSCPPNIKRALQGGLALWRVNMSLEGVSRA